MMPLLVAISRSFRAVAAPSTQPLRVRRSAGTGRVRQAWRVQGGCRAGNLPQQSANLRASIFILRAALP